MDIRLIAAVATNNVIGRNGTLPWHLPADLKHFRALTTGHTVLMGRRTYESIGRPLPNRRCIVVSRTLAAPPGIEVVSSLADALAAGSNERCFVIGGAQLYAEAMPFAEFLHLTKVDANVDGDVYFPQIDWSDWVLESEVPGAEPAAPFKFTFCAYSRRQDPTKPGHRNSR